MSNVVSNLTLYEEGDFELIEPHRGDTIWVDDPNFYYVVQEGSVHLFAVSHKDHDPTHQRLHISTFGAKETIFPLSPYEIPESDEKVSLFISAGHGVVMKKVPIAEREKFLSSHPQLLSNQCDIWLAHLLGCMLPPQRPHNVRTFLTDGTFAEIPRREVAFPGGKALIWVALEEGGCSFLVPLYSNHNIFS